MQLLRLATVLTAPTVALFACAAGVQIQLQPLGQYATGVFEEGAAEICAFEPGSKRLFVTNAFANSIDVVDLSDPSAPVKLFSIDMSVHGAGVNSVDVRGSVVAAAVEADPKTDPGKAVFLDLDGNLLSAVSVGALPDMITFDPAGTRVLVANEGEPSDDYTVDPEGSISIIDLSGGAAGLTQLDVSTAGFAAFNSGPLPPGLRIYGPGASVAQDLEPEYIALSADGKVAWVTLQENNGLAIVDVDQSTVVALKALSLVQNAGGLELYDFESLPVIGTTAAGEDIALGGFSGLFYEGLAANGSLRFVTHGDRGPNAEPKDVDGDGILERPFALPSYQPELIRFELDPATSLCTVTERIPLTQADGTPISGLPNLAGVAGFAHADEEPCDLFGNPLPLDPLGADLEGVCLGEDGFYWMADEYRPSLYKFQADGKLAERFVPFGSNAGGVTTGTEALPAVFAQRRANRGFVAVAWDQGKVYAFIQSPIDNPDVANDASSKASVHLRILEFDLASETTTAQYLYVLSDKTSDKIGEATRVGPGRFLVIERDDLTGPEAIKKVFEIDLAGATNLETLPASIVGPGGTLELMTPAQLVQAGIVPVSKSLAVDLALNGFDRADKPEGLALVEPGRIAVVGDNDYALEGNFDRSTGLLAPNPDPQRPVVSLLRLDRTNPQRLDASDRDEGIRVRNWPLQGMAMPDAIATFSIGGRTLLVTANEGDARDWAAYGEESRIKDLTLDPQAFPEAGELQSDEQLGRLNVSIASGDVDGDGDFDQLHSFGGRGITIWLADGRRLWSSGDLLERAVAEAHPLHFNSDNTDNDSFDSRSDNKGPEPEGIAVGQIDGRTYAFLCLERDSGIAVFDVSDPRQGVMVEYVTTRDFDGDPRAGTAGNLGPEGVRFVPASQSPNGQALILVSYEVSGSVRVFAVERGP